MSRKINIAGVNFCTKHEKTAESAKLPAVWDVLSFVSGSFGQ